MLSNNKIKLKSKTKTEYTDHCYICKKDTVQDCSECYKMTCDNCIGYCTSDYEFECKECWTKSKKDIVLLDELSILCCQKCNQNIVPNNLSLGIKLVCGNCDDSDSDSDNGGYGSDGGHESEDGGASGFGGFYSICKMCNKNDKIKIKCDQCNKLLNADI
jgi:hypothetical protein